MAFAPNVVKENPGVGLSDVTFVGRSKEDIRRPMRQTKLFNWSDELLDANRVSQACEGEKLSMLCVLGQEFKGVEQMSQELGNMTHGKCQGHVMCAVHGDFICSCPCHVIDMAPPVTSSQEETNSPSLSLDTNFSPKMCLGCGFSHNNDWPLCLQDKDN